MPTSSVKLDSKARLYNPSGIGAAYVSTLSSAFSSTERQAAARAALRHDQHLDAHGMTRTAGGLHPMYVHLHGMGSGSEQELQENKVLSKASLADVFDAIATLDHIDGGISLLLRSPGFKPSKTIAAEDIMVDMYISPHELKEGGKDMTKHIALLVQSFGSDLVLPHLHRFDARCTVEGVKPPSPPVAGKQLKVDGPSYLPAPVVKGGPYFRCRCRPAGTLAQDLALHDLPQTPLAPSFPGLKPLNFKPKAAMNKSAMANDDVDIENDPGWLSEAVVEASKYDDNPAVPSIKAPSAPRKSAADGFHGTIISLGPQTDAVLDRFGLDDSLLPRLCVLTCTVCDTQWERALRTIHWGLSYEQAVNLAKAMKQDTGSPHTQQVELSMSWGLRFTLSLLFLAVLMAIFAIIGVSFF